MTLMLLDSASLWYRAYYGMPDTLVNSEGAPVHAIRGFLDMSARLISQYKPNRLVACLDGDWRPSWRVDLFPEYKANRVDVEGDEEAEPETLTPQIPILLDVLEALGIPLIGADDYEADDVIATYSVQEPGPTLIVTGDRDLFQLVDDKRKVKVVYLARGIANHDLVDKKWISTKYEIPGERYALFAMIRGDASDGLPGIKGIGEKGAGLIANSFSSMQEVIQAAQGEDERLTPALRKKLLADIEYARIAERLVHCALDVPIPKVELKIPKTQPDLSRVYQLKEEHNLGASVDRFISAIGW
ncbi:MAG: 5'-3' exonuclease [Actinomycetes bacterium]